MYVKTLSEVHLEALRPACHPIPRRRGRSISAGCRSPDHAAAKPTQLDGTPPQRLTSESYDNPHAMQRQLSRRPVTGTPSQPYRDRPPYFCTQCPKKDLLEAAWPSFWNLQGDEGHRREPGEHMLDRWDTALALDPGQGSQSDFLQMSTIRGSQSYRHAHCITQPLPVLAVHLIHAGADECPRLRIPDMLLLSSC
jgi:hypothetical protein